MNEVDVIKNAIAAWDQDRKDARKATDFLKEGVFFKITRSEFDKWSGLSQKPKGVFAYPGIFDGVLKFVTIDTETAKQTWDEKILPYTFVKEFSQNYGVNDVDFLTFVQSGNVTVVDALKRTVRWDIMMDSWIKEQTADPQRGVFKSFGIPFDSLKDSFANSNVTEIIATLALKTAENPGQDDPKYNADLLLWSTEDSGSGGTLQVQNLLFPCPPYCDWPW